MGYAVALERNRIWRPVLDEDDIRASQKALQTARERLLSERGLTHPTKQARIWWLMEDATETWRRLPDRERSWHILRVMWPEVAREREECRAVEYERQNNINKGTDEYGKRHKANFEAYTPRFAIVDPTAMDRAEIVYKWFRFVRAKNRHRDTAAFIALAGGDGSRAAAREMGGRVTDYAVRRVKLKILRQIEEALSTCIDEW
jgi:hypothetical protein